MRVIQDNLWLCADCLQAAVNDDYSGLDYHYGEPESTNRMNEIKDGLQELGPNLVPDFDSESGDGIDGFSSVGCDCCGSSLAGEMHRFAILGE